jgi:hypothetical protein
MTTSKPVVTREHREHAASAVYEGRGLPKFVRNWVEGVDGRRFADIGELERIAEAMARGAERERAKVVAAVDAEIASYIALEDEEQMPDAYFDERVALEDFKEKIERAEHINASDDVPTSGRKGGG